LAKKASESRLGAIVYECVCVSENSEELSLFIPISKGIEVTGHAAIQKNIDDFSYSMHRP
jgi:hypothetical protein